MLGGFALNNSVWFKLTPTESGVLTVSTANAGTNIDSVLALYADPDAAEVSGLGAPLGCDNNGDGLQNAMTTSFQSDPVSRRAHRAGPRHDGRATDLVVDYACGRDGRTDLLCAAFRSVSAARLQGTTS